MAALPLVYWSTGDANAAHSSSRVNGAHKQAMAATGWALAALSRWHDSGVGSMEMMLVESCRVATRTHASRALPTTVRTPRGHVEGVCTISARSAALLSPRLIISEDARERLS